MKYVYAILSMVLVAFASECTITVSDVEALSKALKEASTNLRDDVICVKEGHYRVSSTLLYVARGEDMKRSIIIRGLGRVVLDGEGKTRIMRISTAGREGGDEGAKVVIENLHFRGGYSERGGGSGLQVQVHSAEVHLKGLHFEENMAVLMGEGHAFGGALNVTSHGGKVVVENSVFVNNRALSGGGAISLYSPRGSEGNFTVKSSTFINNAGRSGGAINANFERGSFVLVNSEFAFNGAEDFGGALSVRTREGKVALVNNTFYSNMAGRSGGAVNLALYTSIALARVYNNIFWENKGRGEDLVVYMPKENTEGSQVEVFNNLLSKPSGTLQVFNRNRFASEENFSANPLFVSTSRERPNLRLKEGSPAVDRGRSDLPELPPTDREGKTRVRGKSVDLGAYEL